jgi:hypothetical protein
MIRDKEMVGRMSRSDLVEQLAGTERFHGSANSIDRRWAKTPRRIYLLS